MIKVMVVDDSPGVRMGLSALLDAADDITVVAACADGDEVADAAWTAEPDVVLMDVTMTRMGGLEATRELLGVRPESRVVMLTGNFSAALVQDAQASGAVGFLPKSGDAAEVLEAIRTVAAGGTAWSRSAAAVLSGG